MPLSSRSRTGLRQLHSPLVEADDLRLALDQLVIRVEVEWRLRAVTVGQEVDADNSTGGQDDEGGMDDAVVRRGQSPLQFSSAIPQLTRTQS